MKKLILFFLCFLNIAVAQEELEVSLATKKALFPIYLSKVQDDGSAFDEVYLDKIRSVLFFDLNHNGLTEIAKQAYEKDFKISHFDEEIAFDKSFWEKNQIAYVIKTEVQNKNLKAYVYNVERNVLKTFSELELTGNINKDRKTIHKFCDNIQEMLFGIKGISSLKILYTIRSKTTNAEQQYISEIYQCDYDGHNSSKISNEKSYFVHPVYIPEKYHKCSNFIFVSYKTGQPKINISPLDTFTPTPLVNLRGNQLLPAIALQKDKIAFISDAAGRPDVFLQNLNKTGHPMGKPIQLFSSPKGTQASPSFSPDGQKIAFVSDKDGTPRIYVLKIPDNLYTKKRPVAQMITKQNRQNVTPAWSYDGKKIAYCAKTEKVRQIWIYDFETGEEWQLTKGDINKENPIWAPNNMHIVYNTEDKLESELYIININQKKPIKITSNKGRKRFPYFEPQIN